MAARSRNKKRAEQARQKGRPDRRKDRRLMRKILLQLIWIGFGLGAIFYLLHDPKEQTNWIGIIAWAALSLAWFLHVSLRWLSSYFLHRKSKV